MKLLKALYQFTREVDDADDHHVLSAFNNSISILATGKE